MNFKNTYINVAYLKPERINEIAEKYSKASGFFRGRDVTGRWRYLCTSNNAIHAQDWSLGGDFLEITEQDLDNYLQQREYTISYPAFDFKINLSNMSEAEKEVAKAWLVSVAESRKMGLGALEEDDFAEYYWCIKSNYNVAGTEEIDGRYYFSDTKTTELFLTFSKPTITSWETPFKKSEKELQLEELVGRLGSDLSRLQQQLKEAEQQLENLK